MSFCGINSDVLLKSAVCDLRPENVNEILCRIYYCEPYRLLISWNLNVPLGRLLFCHPQHDLLLPEAIISEQFFCVSIITWVCTECCRNAPLCVTLMVESSSCRFPFYVYIQVIISSVQLSQVLGRVWYGRTDCHVVTAVLAAKIWLLRVISLGFFFFFLHAFLKSFEYVLNCNWWSQILMRFVSAET